MWLNHTGLNIFIIKISAGTFFVNLKYVPADLFGLPHHFHYAGSIIFFQFPGYIIRYWGQARVVGPFFFHDDFLPCIKIALRDGVYLSAAGQNIIVICLYLFIRCFKNLAYRAAAEQCRGVFDDIIPNRHHAELGAFLYLVFTVSDETSQFIGKGGIVPSIWYPPPPTSGADPIGSLPQFLPLTCQVQSNIPAASGPSQNRPQHPCECFPDRFPY